MELRSLGLLLLLTQAMVDLLALEDLGDLGTLEGSLDSTTSSSLALVTSPQGFLPALALKTRAPRRSASTSVTSLEDDPAAGTAIASQRSSTHSLTLLAATLASRLTRQVDRRELSLFMQARAGLLVTVSMIITTPPLTRRSCLTDLLSVSTGPRSRTQMRTV